MAGLPKRIHFVGIGGIGMSGLARLLLEEGHQVSGSDLQANNLTAELERLGATIFQGHHAKQLGAAALVVATPAAHSDNPELQAAVARHLPVIKRGELLGQLMEGKRGIAVAGSHGKSTTTALIGWTLVQAGLEPTVVVGGEVPELGGNVRRGRGPYFVAEADEFDAAFLSLHPEVAVVTNIEPEHLDYYGTFEHVVETFQRFLQAVPPSGHIVFCLDDLAAGGLQSGEANSSTAKLNSTNQQRAGGRLTGKVRTQSLISYGFQAQARWQATDLHPNRQGGTDFIAREQGDPSGAFSLRIPGKHNVSNALAAIATARIFDVPVSVIQQALASFGGVKRRFQILGEPGGITVVDDYAHHPSEVRATLAAARSRYPNRRILAVFQPHTYSRVKLLLPLFADAFTEADALWVTEIYAAREDNTWRISGRDLVDSLNHSNAAFVPTLDAAGDAVQREARPGDVVLVMGAGDSTILAEALVERLEKTRGAV